MDFLFNNGYWYIYGILLGLFVPLLLVVGNKLFGLSSSIVHLCSIILPRDKARFMNYDFKEHKWKFFFVVGIVIGAFITQILLTSQPKQFLPAEYFTTGGMIKLFIGGLLVGFGTRYANGCTSGHSITGLSLLQKSSLVATIAFFIGGLLYTFFNYYIFN